MSRRKITVHRYVDGDLVYTQEKNLLVKTLPDGREYVKSDYRKMIVHPGDNVYFRTVDRIRMDLVINPNYNLVPVIHINPGIDWLPTEEDLAGDPELADMMP